MPVCGISKVPAKLVMLPSIARKRREVVEERMAKCRALAETAPFNRIDAGDTRRGFITSGVSYLYVKEAFPGGRGPQARHVLAAAGTD